MRVLLALSSLFLAVAVVAPHASAQARTLVVTKSAWAMLNPQPLPPEPPPHDAQAKIVKPNADARGIIIVSGKTQLPALVLRKIR